MPSRVALWALNLSNRLLVAWLATSALAGVFVVAANVASSVALLVTAFQLAWPPFAYGIKEDDEARRVYSAVLTAWLLVALAAVLPLALAREWVMALLAGEKYTGGADAMALLALGLAFYGAYYVVGVAVGRAKQTQLNWVVTGAAAAANVLLCIFLIPEYGANGAGAASATAFLLMAVLMVLRGGRVFPVRYDWPRLGGPVRAGGGAVRDRRARVPGPRGGRRRRAPRRRGALRAARAHRRSGSASRSASAVTAACLLAARWGPDSCCAASNTRRPACAKAAGVGTGARVRTSTKLFPNVATS